MIYITMQALMVLNDDIVAGLNSVWANFAINDKACYLNWR